jgi:hypothetical protein
MYMKLNRLLVLLCLGGVTLLMSCSPATPCAPAALGAPGNLSPANKAIAPLTPSLHWEYPSSAPSPYPYPAGATGCSFTGYQVHLVSSVDLTIEHGGTVGASTTSFAPGTPLQPATLYFWEVRVLTVGGTGPWSGWRAFYTGPVCETSSLAAPILYSPSGVIHDVWPTLNWAYPGSSCLPQGYRIDLSTSASFADTSLSGGTGNPSTSWAPAHELNTCTDYYWRVAAINDITLGPFSSTNSFRIVPEGTICVVYFVPASLANCRVGPGTLYPLVTTVNRGDELPVLGRHQTQDGTWFDLRTKNNLECWVADVTGDLIGDPNLVPFIITLPSLPEPKPGGGSGCGGISDPAVCGRTPGCYYDYNTYTCRIK